MLTELILYALIGGLFSLAGGVAVLFKKDIAIKAIIPLLSFAAGAFLSASLLDILPEALELSAEPHPILLTVLAGFVAFFILERFLMKFLYSHDKGGQHSEHTESLPFLLILGDSLHNFVDGIVIALAFIANPALGLTSALAIAAHEIPQEIGDFSILLHQGWNKGRIIAVNILQSLLTIPGVIIGYYAGSALEPHMPYLLAAASGIFLYLGASDLIPEIHHNSGHKYFYRAILPLTFGVAAVWYLVSITH